MRRRSKNNSVSLATAILVELGTVLAIVALAQPTWTRGLIERTIDMPHPQDPAARDLQDSPASFGVELRTLSPSSQLFDDPSSRVARADNWSRTDSLPSFETPVWRATPADPVYPPTPTRQELFPWNARY